MQRTGSHGVMSPNTLPCGLSLMVTPGRMCRHEAFQHPEEVATTIPQTPRPKPAPSAPTQASTLEEGFWESLPRKAYVRTVLPAKQIHLPRDFPNLRT